MHKEHIMNIVLAALIYITTFSLWSIGEKRVDAYIALYTIEYFVLKAVFRPRRRYFDLLAVILLTVFVISVVYRISEVLFS